MTREAGVPSGIQIQYAEGLGEITEAPVKRLLKKIRKGTCKRVYLALGPDGESSYFEMLRENGYAFLVIGEERMDSGPVDVLYELRPAVCRFRRSGAHPGWTGYDFEV